MVHAFQKLGHNLTICGAAVTASALAAYKARGGKLGGSRSECRNLTSHARRKGAETAGAVVREKAREAYADICDDISEMRKPGMSLMQIARNLNDRGHTTRRERPWNAMQVRRVLTMT